MQRRQATEGGEVMEALHCSPRRKRAPGRRSRGRRSSWTSRGDGWTPATATVTTTRRRVRSGEADASRERGESIWEGVSGGSAVRVSGRGGYGGGRLGLGSAQLGQGPGGFLFLFFVLFSVFFLFIFFSVFIYL